MNYDEMDKMNWDQLISSKRFGMENYHDERTHNRTDFQRDYDRLIFSSPFRRLQNKTQVFPLPGSIFVHNRLTHSLEVSCVGRSLGYLAGRALREKYPHAQAGFEYIESIVSAACLAHDLGNPPFGHSGEKAISTYFSEGEGIEMKGKILQEGGRWTDFINFEGNANSIRLLMHQFHGRRQGGFALTYSTLASIVKYPYSSEKTADKNKFGFFQSEEEGFARIADSLGMCRLGDDPLCYCRYPLVYLVEAADDICYQIMDLEDAHKLHIFSTEETINLLMSYFPSERHKHMSQTMERVEDVNEKIAYLRSSVIGMLVNECVNIFVQREDEILEGKLKGSLINHLPEEIGKSYRKCSEISAKKIYHSKDVLDVEIAGYRIISFLLQTLLHAVENPDHVYSKVLLNRIPEQYQISVPAMYGRTLAVLDFVSGMTDVYALDLYRKITGMSLPAL
jgi:dGTPase